MDPFQDKKQQVDNMYTVMWDLERELVKIRKNIDNAEKELKNLCPKHDFRMEDNGDYHSPGYNYICKNCSFFTNIRPNSCSNK